MKIFTTTNHSIKMSFQNDNRVSNILKCFIYCSINKFISDLGGIGKDDYKNSPLMHYSLAKEKQKEVQKLV